MLKFKQDDFNEKWFLIEDFSIKNLQKNLENFRLILQSEKILERFENKFYKGYENIYQNLEFGKKIQTNKPR